MDKRAKGEIKMEDPQNVVMICKDCAEKMFLIRGLSMFKVGEFVKLKFTDKFGTEYMWVKAIKVDKENNKYEGLLDNDPVLVRCVTYGDKVEFHKENVLETPKE